jgi:hypothetical protein
MDSCTYIIKFPHEEENMIAHACDTSYLQGREEKIRVWNQTKQVNETPSQKPNQAWWFVNVNPAMQEVKERNLWSETGLRQKENPT